MHRRLSRILFGAGAYIDGGELVSVVIGHKAPLYVASGLAAPFLQSASLLVLWLRRFDGSVSDAWGVVHSWHSIDKACKQSSREIPFSSPVGSRSVSAELALAPTQRISCEGCVAKKYSTNQRNAKQHTKTTCEQQSKRKTHNTSKPNENAQITIN